MKDKEINIFNERLQIIDEKIRLNKLIAFNLKLYQKIVKHAKDNNISLPLNYNIISLVTEIEELTFKHHKSLKLPAPFLKPQTPKSYQNRLIRLNKAEIVELSRRLEGYESLTSVELLNLVKEVRQ